MTRSGSDGTGPRTGATAPVPDVAGGAVHPGSRLVMHSCVAGVPARDGEILEVRGPGGGPPYLVRWSSDGRVSLVFPGAGATIAART